MLDRETGVDLNVLPRNARVLCQRDEHVRAVLEIRLQGNEQKSANCTLIRTQDQPGTKPVQQQKMKKRRTYLFPQRRRLLQLPDLLLAILQPPLRQQQPRQHRIAPHFPPLRLRHTLHQMQLRSLGNAVRHARPADTAPRNRTRHQHHSPLLIRVKHRHRSRSKRFHAQNISPPAPVPLLIAQGVEVREVREARPARVGDHDVQTAEGFGGGFDQRRDFGSRACVGFEDGGFHAVRGFELRGEGLRGGGVVGVVDGDVAAFCGEGAGDFGAETSGLVVRSMEEGFFDWEMALAVFESMVCMVYRRDPFAVVFELVTTIGTTASRPV